MSLHNYNHARNETYFRTILELQAKLQKSEEERIKLQSKLNATLQEAKESERNYNRKLADQQRELTKYNKKRTERNETIVHTLNMIEKRLALIDAKTENFKLMHNYYCDYFLSGCQSRYHPDLQQLSYNFGSTPNLILRQNPYRTHLSSHPLPSTSDIPKDWSSKKRYVSKPQFHSDESSSEESIEIVKNTLCNQYEIQKPLYTKQTSPISKINIKYKKGTVNDQLLRDKFDQTKRKLDDLLLKYKVKSSTTLQSSNAFGYSPLYGESVDDLIRKYDLEREIRERLSNEFGVYKYLRPFSFSSSRASHLIDNVPNLYSSKNASTSFQNRKMSRPLKQSESNSDEIVSKPSKTVHFSDTDQRENEGNTSSLEMVQKIEEGKIEKGEKLVKTPQRDVEDEDVIKKEPVIETVGNSEAKPSIAIDLSATKEVPETKVELDENFNEQNKVKSAEETPYPSQFHAPYNVDNAQSYANYDENAQPIQYYDGQYQYDEHGQPIQYQYDENGQPYNYQYDGTDYTNLNEQYLPQYDENGELIQYQYDKEGQLLFDEQGKPLVYPYGTNEQAIYEQYAVEPENSAKNIDESVSRANETPQNPAMLTNESDEGKSVSQSEPKTETKSNSSAKGEKVLQMLESDVESGKQDTKISNDSSDFEFSNW